MLAIAVIAFAVKGALGDPLRENMGEAVPEAQRAELRHKLGLDAPWPTQLVRYLGTRREAISVSPISINVRRCPWCSQIPGELRARACRKPHRALRLCPRRHLLRGEAAILGARLILGLACSASRCLCFLPASS
jgi:hypothetical protein